MSINLYLLCSRYISNHLRFYFPYLLSQVMTEIIGLESKVFILIKISHMKNIINNNKILLTITTTIHGL